MCDVSMYVRTYVLVCLCMYVCMYVCMFKYLQSEREDNCAGLGLL